MYPAFFAFRLSTFFYVSLASAISKALLSEIQRFVNDHLRTVHQCHIHQLPSSRFFKLSALYSCNPDSNLKHQPPKYAKRTSKTHQQPPPQLLLVVCKAAAQSAQRIGRAHQNWVADLLGRLHGSSNGVAASALSDLLSTGFNHLEAQGDAEAEDGRGVR